MAELFSVDDKLRAIDMCDDKTVTEVAVVFGVSRQAIYDWKNKFESGGVCHLAPQSRKPKRTRSTTTQAEKSSVINIWNSNEVKTIAEVRRVLNRSLSRFIIKKILQDHFGVLWKSISDARKKLYEYRAKGMLELDPEDLLEVLFENSADRSVHKRFEDRLAEPPDTNEIERLKVEIYDELRKVADYVS